MSLSQIAFTKAIFQYQNNYDDIINKLIMS